MTWPVRPIRSCRGNSRCARTSRSACSVRHADQRQVVAAQDAAEYQQLNGRIVAQLVDDARLLVITVIRLPRSSRASLAWSCRCR